MFPDSKNLWRKSIENRRVCRLAISNGHYNAAASRYYYALRLAVHALFKQKQIHGQRAMDRSGQMVEKWRHNALIAKVDQLFGSKISGIKEILDMALELREKGDYEPFPVAQPRLEVLKRLSRGVFRRILNEIKGI